MNQSNRLLCLDVCVEEIVAVAPRLAIDFLNRMPLSLLETRLLPEFTLRLLLRNPEMRALMRAVRHRVENDPYGTALQSANDREIALAILGYHYRRYRSTCGARHLMQGGELETPRLPVSARPYQDGDALDSSREVLILANGVCYAAIRAEAISCDVQIIACSACVGAHVAGCRSTDGCIAGVC